MRSTLVLTLSIIMLIDIGMLIFLSAPWLFKILLIPAIGSSSLICFFAGHYSEEAHKKALMTLLTTIIITYLGIYFLLNASTTAKTFFFISLCFSFISCYSFGHANDNFNKKFQKEFDDIKY